MSKIDTVKIRKAMIGLYGSDIIDFAICTDTELAEKLLAYAEAIGHKDDSDLTDEALIYMAALRLANRRGGQDV